MTESKQTPEKENISPEQEAAEEVEVEVEVAAPEQETPQSETAKEPTSPEGQQPAEEKKHKKKPKKHHGKSYSQKDMDASAEELLKTQKQRDEYLDMAQRQKAEFNNFRKRSETQRLEAHGNGARETISAILPAVDNMYRALDQFGNIADDDPLKQGVVMVFKQLDETLKNLGMEKIDSLGEMFDPNFHHAVVEGEASDNYPAGTVMEVLQDGYKVNEKIIRYAMVKVAK